MRGFLRGYGRGRVLGAVSGAIAVLGLVSAAGAAAVERGKTVDTVSLDFGSLFAPSQFDRDGSVYGVRANAHGTGSETVLVSHFTSATTTTPGACPGGGGWCDTPHNIAAKADGWDFHVTGVGVTIGIVDSGIDLNNQEFAGRVLPGTCFKWSENPCSTAFEKMGGDSGVSPKNTTHGTHVTGIAAGENVGIAPGAMILPVKVCSSTAEGCNRVNAGIHYAATHGANVINVSIGGPGLTAGDVKSLAKSVHATPDGVLLVVAGGNAGAKDPSSGYLAGAALQDGVRGRMLVVGAAACNGTSNGGAGNCANNGVGGPSTFGQQPSSRCEIHSGVSYCMRDFFVMAPGVDIWSSVGNAKKTNSKYGYLSGTSMASPYVTGLAALVKSQNLSMSADDVAQIILSTADDLGAPGHDPIFGAGMVNVTRALAPISLTSGAPQARVPVSGSNISGALATRSNALASVMSGPLTGALKKSQLLKNALVVDSYGRPYTVDLTKATDNRTLGFTNILFSDQFLGFSPFDMAVQGPLGILHVSGLGVRSTTPALLSGNFLTEDKNDYQVRDLLIDAPLTELVSMNVGYRVDSTAGIFNRYDANSSGAYDGLFISAAGVNSPYASLTDGGSFLGTTLKLANDLHFSMAQSMLTPERDRFSVNPYSTVTQLMGQAPLVDQRYANATVASLNWDAARWAGIGFTASQTAERNGMLGGLNTAALSLAGNAKTTAVGMSGRVGFGDGWVTTASYSQGITQLDLTPSSIITSSSDLRSRSYGLAVAKHGLFDHNDSLGLALSRPIQVYSGTANLVAATALDTKTGILTYGSENLSLATRTPETDVELGYVTTFLDGRLALQTNAAYQMNLSGENGRNGLAVVSRAKINF